MDDEDGGGLAAWAIGGVVLLAGSLLVFILLLLAGAGGKGAEESRENPDEGGHGAPVEPGQMPEGWEKWVNQGGSICPEVSPSLIAAIGWAETRWQTDLVSPVGAVGPWQFMPETWAAIGRDADGDGVADPRSPADAAVTAGHFLCTNADMISGWGLPPNVDNLAASYNAGPGAVRKYDGVPPYPETQNYVAEVRRKMGEIVTGPGVDEEVPNPGAAAVIEAAMSQQGVPYSWGGGDFFGPTLGSNSKGDTPGGPWDGRNIIGFDCSGLMEFAFYKGTNGEVRMGDTTRDQIQQGHAISVRDLRAGDIVVFDDPDTGIPFHVALYIGNHQFVHAPSPGKTVMVEDLHKSPFWSSLTWHPRRIL